MGYAGIQGTHQLRSCFYKSLLGLHSSRARARDYLWQPRRAMNCNRLCPWELFFLFVCECVRQRDWERERLLSFAKSGFNPTLSFSSSCMFLNAEAFCDFRACDFRVGSAKGSFQRTSCSRNFWKKPFFFRRQGRSQQKWWQNSFLKVWREWHCCTAPGPVLCRRTSPAVELCQILRQLDRSQLPPFPSLAFPSSARGPHPGMECHRAERASFHTKPAS